MGKKATKTDANEFGCEFGSVSIGKETAKLACKINRHFSKLELAEAEKYFCGRRLTCQVVLRRSDEDESQQKLVDDLDFEMRFVCDVKRMSVTPDEFSIGLTMNINEVSVAELAQFANRPGRLLIFESGQIPADEGGASNG